MITRLEEKSTSHTRICLLASRVSGTGVEHVSNSRPHRLVF
jgi:hypothetical protein